LGDSITPFLFLFSTTRIFLFDVLSKIDIVFYRQDYFFFGGVGDISKLAGVANLKEKGVWPANDISHTHIPPFLRVGKHKKFHVVFLLF
jgi:hypothetical protein